jgi:hypothetical protein
VNFGGVEVPVTVLVSVSAIGVTLLIAFTGAMWRIASRMASIDTKMDSLTGIPDRVTKLEVRLERIEDVMQAQFEVVPSDRQH